jgi:tRNA modification GTPase
MADTIVALSTPLGRSGLGVVRLSGTDPLSIISPLIQKGDLSPRRAHLTQLIDPESDEPIDEAIVTYFRAPNSFTGDDVIEISCHGSPVVLRQVIDVCLRSGARLAEAGEFSLRALSNGRMDLTEAEAIRDLIDSQTVASARQAVRQLRGEFSHELQPIKDELLDVIVVLESALEFVEEDLPGFQYQDIHTRLTAIRNTILKTAGTFKAGHLIREGLRVAIVGRPNVGKSSLFNALLGHDRAIVTDIAGTTRDQLHEKLTIDEIPISLIDTAGLRETSDAVESIGVERSRRTMSDADIVIVLLDASQQVTKDDFDILESVADLEHLVAFNKIDILTGKEAESCVAGFAADRRNKQRIVAISAKTGEGLGQLKKAIVRPFESETTDMSGFLVSDARHHDLLNRTAAEIGHALDSLEAKASEEITLIGLHNAMRFLGEITGETTTEDMLTRIFSTFCIGK